MAQIKQLKDSVTSHEFYPITHEKAVIGLEELLDEKTINFVLNLQYNKDLRVISAALNDLNARLLGTSDDLNAQLLDISNNLNFLPLTGGTMSGDITMPGETKLIFGDTSVYNNGSLFIDGALQVESSITAGGFTHASYNSDNYVLLAGGGTKLLSEITPDMSGYLPLSGGEMTGPLTFRLSDDSKKWIDFGQTDAYIKPAEQDGMLLYGSGA
jgi:hypothetical protein